jgi:transposase
MISLWLKKYTEEYKRHLLDLVREGRTPEQLAQEYEPSARTIRNWLRAAEAKSSVHEADKDRELKRLKAEVSRLREERYILKKAAAWFAMETVSTPKKGTRS